MDVCGVGNQWWRRRRQWMQERRKLRETSAGPIPPGLVCLMRVHRYRSSLGCSEIWSGFRARFHVYSTDHIYLLHGRSGAPGAATTSRLSALRGRAISRDRVNLALLPEMASPSTKGDGISTHRGGRSSLAPPRRRAYQIAEACILFRAHVTDSSPRGTPREGSPATKNADGGN